MTIIWRDGMLKLHGPKHELDVLVTPGSPLKKYGILNRHDNGSSMCQLLVNTFVWSDKRTAVRFVLPVPRKARHMHRDVRPCEQCLLESH